MSLEQRNKIATSLVDLITEKCKDKKMNADNVTALSAATVALAKIAKAQPQDLPSSKSFSLGND